MKNRDVVEQYMEMLRRLDQLITDLAVARLLETNNVQAGKTRHETERHIESILIAEVELREEISIFLNKEIS